MYRNNTNHREAFYGREDDLDNLYEPNIYQPNPMQYSNDQVENELYDTNNQSDSDDLCSDSDSDDETSYKNVYDERTKKKIKKEIDLMYSDLDK